MKIRVRVESRKEWGAVRRRPQIAGQVEITFRSRRRSNRARVRCPECFSVSRCPHQTCARFRLKCSKVGPQEFGSKRQRKPLRDNANLVLNERGEQVIDSGERIEGQPADDLWRSSLAGTRSSTPRKPVPAYSRMC